MVTSKRVSRRVRRPKRKKSAVKRKPKGVKKTSISKVKKEFTEKQIESMQETLAFGNIGGGTRKTDRATAIKFLKIEKAQLKKEVKKLKKKIIKKKPVKQPTGPPQFFDPAVEAERRLRRKKYQKRKALKISRAALPPDFMDGGFEMHYVGSSNILAVGYRAALKVMRVMFIGGAVYDYNRVPESVYESILEQGTRRTGSGSAGKALHQQVKVFTPQSPYFGSKYTYTKVR